MNNFEAGHIALVIFFTGALIALGLCAFIEWVLIPALVERNNARFYAKLKEIENDLELGD